MKAFAYHQYGSPKVLRSEEVSKPEPADHEILIKVRSISLNPAEWHYLNATIFLVRLEAGMLKPKNPYLFADISGTVAATGRLVSDFKPGDEIMGRNKVGGYAEYACIASSDAVHKPANISFSEAAATPLAALTALQGLNAYTSIQPGQKVLINGASGGIGTFAVQLAKLKGAEVTGVCSTRNLELVQSIGADYVIDYLQEDFTRQGKKYDLILDAIGNRSPSDLSRALKQNGFCSVVGFTNFFRLSQVMMQGKFIAAASKKIVRMYDAKMRKDDLAYIASLIEANKITPVIERHYAFEETPEAFRHLGSRRARGKIVIDLHQQTNGVH